MVGVSSQGIVGSVVRMKGQADGSSGGWTHSLLGGCPRGWMAGLVDRRIVDV